MTFKAHGPLVFQTGPVRLFVPYKRRKKDSESCPPSPPLSSPLPIKKQRINSVKSPAPPPSQQQISNVTSPVSLATIVPANSISKDTGGMYLWQFYCMIYACIFIKTVIFIHKYINLIR